MIRRLVRGPGDDDSAFSAERARSRAARAFVLLVMPTTILLVTFLTVASWLAEPDQVPAPLWMANLAFWVLQFVLATLVLRGVDAVRVTGAFLVLATVVEFVALFSSPEPVSSSASILFFIVIGSYFLTPWFTAAFTVVVSIGISLAAYAIDDWGEHFLIPSTAFITLITGVGCAIIMASVRRTEQRLERVARAQRDALVRVEQVGASRDRLIANVSHELRTPLTATIGSIETMMRDDVQMSDEQRDELMRIARDGGLRLLSLVEDLLTIGSTRPDSLKLEPEPERLGRIAVDAIAGIDAGHGRAVRVVAVEEPLVRVDRLRMLQVVTNLVVNAIRHGGGDVLVRIDEDHDRAVLQVIDDGPGVPAQHVDELFLPFARFSTRSDSTGLGLAICRTLVEAHGGTIRYTRSADGHTVFECQLPIERAEARRTAEASFPPAT